MSNTTLKRDISAVSLLISAAGGMIGSGWLFSSFYSARIAGAGALVAWLLGTIFMAVIALPLCELGTIYPISGGLANYPKFTHGVYIGFLFSWLTWLSYVVMTPIEVQAVLQYASIFYPGLMHTVPGASGGPGVFQLTGLGFCWAFVLMLALVCINTLGIRLVAESNKWVSVWKFMVPLFAAGAFISQAPSFHVLKTIHFKSVLSWDQIFSALSMGGIVFAYTGFQNGLVLAGEVKDPQRNIPLSILGALITGFCIYFLLQFAFLVALPVASLEHGFANLSFAGDAGPLVGLAAVLGLTLCVKLLLIDAVVSPFGTSLIYTTASSRILYGMAENRFLPRALLRLNKNRVPYLTLLINFIFGLMAFFPFPSWQNMVSFLSSTAILSYAVGPICLLSLRTQKPDLDRPFRLPLARVFCYLGFFFCNLMLYWCGLVVLNKLYIAILISLVFALVFYRKHQDVPFLKTTAWFLGYITCLFAIAHAGNFGGRGLLAAPYDYVCIFVCSVVALKLSHSSCLRGGGGPDTCGEKG